MIISTVEISNFRCHKQTITNLSDTNVLIGQNNSGKTSFLEAINHAIGIKRRIPSEDDFYANDGNFNPKTSDPIKIILEFRK